MDSVIAVELGILIFLAFAIGGKAGELLAAVQNIGPQLKRLEDKADGIESVVRDLRPKYDRNPDPYPDFPQDR